MKIKTFDGYSDLSIESSLASVFQTDHENFGKAFTDYYIKHINDFDNIDIDDFIDFLIEKSPTVTTSELVFNQVCLFHKTSTIDNLKTIKKHGLLQLRKALELDTELNAYLKRKGVSFHVIDNIPFITYNGIKTELKKHDGFHSFFSKANREDRLHYRLTRDYNINGYLYYEGAIKDTSYQHIKHIPEFLMNVSEYLRPDIKSEWESISTPYILKFAVDINDIDMVDDFSEVMDSHQITRHIITISLEYMLNKLRYMFSGGYSTPIKYIFTKMNQTVPPQNIIDYIKY